MQYDWTSVEKIKPLISQKPLLLITFAEET